MIWTQSNAAMGDERQTGFSTPEVQPDDAVSLTIDDAKVTVPPGNSGLRAAALTRLKRPSQCAVD